MHAGDVVVIPPGDIHSTDALSNRGCDIDVLQFTNEFLCDRENVSKSLSSDVVRADEKIQMTFDKLNQYSQNNQVGNSQLMAGLVQMLTGFLMQSSGKKSIFPRSAFIDIVCAYVEQAQDLRLESVAKHLGYSPEHLSRQFSKVVGVSYRDWCDRIRMRRALVMLNDGQYSISAIASVLGYSDNSSFIRAFKRMYGITPSVCRHRRMFV